MYHHGDTVLIFSNKVVHKRDYQNAILEVPSLVHNLKTVTWYLDGAHTEDSMKAAATWYQSQVGSLDKDSLATHRSGITPHALRLVLSIFYAFV